MKKLIFFLMLLIAFATHTGLAQGNSAPQLKLRQCSSLPNFDYTYISPLMLKTMKSKELKKFQDIPIEKVSHIEILKTRTSGKNDTFKSILNKLSDEEGFKLVAYNADADRGVKICAETATGGGSSDPSQEVINRLLVIQWSSYGAAHNVIYLVGNFSSDDLNSLFRF